MNRRGLTKALPFLGILLLGSIISIILYFFYVNRETLIISHESGIYSASFDLSFFTLKSGTIMYTVNGQAPDKNSADTYEYKEPISLKCLDETSTYSFQICCFYDDGTQSDVYRRDYILDEKGNERFSTTYIVSITGSEEELFGEEEGIFVRGNQYYEYIAEHPEANVLVDTIPANYYMDIEVPVHAAIFQKDGTQIIEQNCGIKIYGNTTRQHNQKSFRLYARYIYDQKNEFSYPFFKDLYTEKGNMPITDWQRLSFHNSGTDHDFGYVRTELVSKLARMSGYPDTLGAESVTVYINNKYQGVYWLQNSYDDRYFKEKYGNYIGEMVVCEGSLGEMSTGAARSESEEAYCLEYNELCQWINSADMSDDANWERVCAAIDIENFAHYFALEYYSDNLDWPQNNVKVYRYNKGDGEDYQQGTVFDGKYRFLLFDLDYCMGLYFLDIHGNDVSTQRLHDFLNANTDTALFRSLSQRKEFRDMFVGKVLYLMNETFTKNKVFEVLSELNDTRNKELGYMIEETALLQGSIWEEWGVGKSGMEKTEAEWNEILVYASERPQYIIQELQQEWACGETISLDISLEESGNMLIGNMDIGKGYDGVWLSNVPLNLSCSLPVGMHVQGYRVNTDYVEGEVLQLTSEEIAKLGDKIVIEPVIEIAETESLIVSSYRIKDSQDVVVLQNNGTAALNLNEYTITDDMAELSKATFPSIVLEPGETFQIYGVKYAGNMEINSIQVPFSWSDEEKVYLYKISNEP